MPYLGPGAVFDHVGVAVRSIRDLAPEVEVFDDRTQRVSVAFVDLAGLRLELIQPGAEPSPIDGNLQKGQTLVHLCFRVPSLDLALQFARESGLHQLARPVAATAFGGRRIAWLFNTSVGLVELLEDHATSATPAA
jgi:methylmalonyl-CoA/ethylmalonyl-CoA epimerase